MFDVRSMSCPFYSSGDLSGHWLACWEHTSVLAVQAVVLASHMSTCCDGGGEEPVPGGLRHILEK